MAMPRTYTLEELALKIRGPAPDWMEETKQMQVGQWIKARHNLVSAGAAPRSTGLPEASMEMLETRIGMPVLLRTSAQATTEIQEMEARTVAQMIHTVETRAEIEKGMAT